MRPFEIGRKLISFYLSKILGILQTIVLYFIKKIKIKNQIYYILFKLFHQL
jgi:hypothetical protein